MKRIALVALLAASGCGEVTQTEPGPLGTFYFPTGVGVASGRLLVASSNFDLRYDSETGGSLISVDPAAGNSLEGALNIRSFAGEVAVAERGVCPDLAGAAAARALVPTRGSNSLYAVAVGADGSLSCDGCELSFSGNPFVDPFAVGVVCGPGLARAYVTHLRSTTGRAWFTQADLSVDPPLLEHRADGFGRVRDFAYEATRERLWVVGGTANLEAPLRWIDLSGGCRFERDPEAELPADACPTGSAGSTTLPAGLELRSLALGHAEASPRRAYLTARRYDPAVAATLGLSAPDLGGVLLVADLAEDLTGRVDLRVVRSFEIGFGASKVRVLPERPGRRDVVVALAADEGVLWVYDDETGDRASLGRDPVTGAPAAGHEAFGLAVDPATRTDPLVPGEVGRVYVSSFEDGHVTPFDVPLDAAWSVYPPRPLARITGGAP